MKDWLKHSNGFLNIDDDFIYATKSGNWSEVTDLEEKNAVGFKAANFASKFKAGIYIAAVIGVTIFVVTKNLLQGSLVIGLPILAYFSYKYMVPEYRASFSIPIKKIKDIEIKKESVRVEFEDAKGSIVSNDFRELDKKGFLIIQKVKDNLELQNGLS